ncbi:hypothetical protein ACVFYP_22170 [Roseomonas sp. F4]
MSSKTSFRAAVETDRKRIILSISERPKSFDLQLGLHPAALLADAGVPLFVSENTSNEHGKTVKNQYYSIHASPNSPHHNFIKHTLVYGDNEEIITRHKTSAIKSKKAFAHVYSRRFTDLASTAYDFKNSSGTTLLLDKFDATTFNLVLSVFVGDRSLEFSGTASEANIRQHKTHLFTVVLVWSYLSFPSSASGEFAHRLIPTDQDLDHLPEAIELFRPLEAGLTPIECIKAHRRDRRQFLDNLKREWLLAVPNEPSLAKYFGAVEPFRIGRKGTAQWRDYVLRLAALELPQGPTSPILR